MRDRGSRLSGSAFCYRYTIVLRTSAQRLVPPWPDLFRGPSAHGLVPWAPTSLPSAPSNARRRGWPDQVRPRGSWVVSGSLQTTDFAQPDSRGRALLIFQPKREVLLQICCRCSHWQQSVQLMIAGSSTPTGPLG